MAVAYRIDAEAGTITRLSDGVAFPHDDRAPEFAAYAAWLAAGGTPEVGHSDPVPDLPTLADWRVGLLLWGRLEDVTNKVATLMASSVPAEAVLGGIAHQQLEYSNNVSRARLLAIHDAFGFSLAEVDESLHRADRAARGDLSGVWPLPA